MRLVYILFSMFKPNSDHVNVLFSLPPASAYQKLNSSSEVCQNACKFNDSNGKDLLSDLSDITTGGLDQLSSIISHKKEKKRKSGLKLSSHSILKNVTKSKVHFNDELNNCSYKDSFSEKEPSENVVDFINSNNRSAFSCNDSPPCSPAMHTDTASDLCHDSLYNGVWKSKFDRNHSVDVKKSSYKTDQYFVDGDLIKSPELIESNQSGYMHRQLPLKVQNVNSYSNEIYSNDMTFSNLNNDNQCITADPLSRYKLSDSSLPFFSQYASTLKSEADCVSFNHLSDKKVNYVNKQRSYCELSSSPAQAVRQQRFLKGIIRKKLHDDELKIETSKVKSDSVNLSNLRLPVVSSISCALSDVNTGGALTKEEADFVRNEQTFEDVVSNPSLHRWNNRRMGRAKRRSTKHNSKRKFCFGKKINMNKKTAGVLVSKDGIHFIELGKLLHSVYRYSGFEIDGGSEIAVTYIDDKDPAIQYISENKCSVMTCITNSYPCSSLTALQYNPTFIKFMETAKHPSYGRLDQFSSLYSRIGDVNALNCSCIDKAEGVSVIKASSEHLLSKIKNNSKYYDVKSMKEKYLCYNCQISLLYIFYVVLTAQSNMESLFLKAAVSKKPAKIKSPNCSDLKLCKKIGNIFRSNLLKKYEMRSPSDDGYNYSNKLQIHNNGKKCSSKYTLRSNRIKMQNRRNINSSRNSDDRFDFNSSGCKLYENSSQQQHRNSFNLSPNEINDPLVQKNSLTDKNDIAMELPQVVHHASEGIDEDKITGVGNTAEEDRESNNLVCELSEVDEGYFDKDFETDKGDVKLQTQLENEQEEEYECDFTVTSPFYSRIYDPQRNSVSTFELIGSNSSIFKDQLKVKESLSGNVTDLSIDKSYSNTKVPLSGDTEEKYVDSILSRQDKPKECNYWQCLNSDEKFTENSSKLDSFHCNMQEKGGSYTYFATENELSTHTKMMEELPTTCVKRKHVPSISSNTENDFVKNNTLFSSLKKSLVRNMAMRSTKMIVREENETMPFVFKMDATGSCERSIIIPKLGKNNYSGGNDHISTDNQEKEYHSQLVSCNSNSTADIQNTLLSSQSEKDIEEYLASLVLTNLCSLSKESSSYKKIQQNRNAPKINISGFEEINSTSSYKEKMKLCSKETINLMRASCEDIILTIGDKSAKIPKLSKFHSHR